MTNDIIERRYRRMKWFAITGWVSFALAVAGGIFLWWVMGVREQRAEKDYQHLIEHEKKRASIEEELSRARTELLLARLKTEHLTALVLQLGGRVEKDKGHIVVVNLSNTKTADVDIDKLLRLFDPKGLKSVNLKGTGVTDAGVEKKAKLPNVEIIR